MPSFFLPAAVRPLVDTTPPAGLLDGLLLPHPAEGGLRGAESLHDHPRELLAADQARGATLPHPAGGAEGGAVTGSGAVTPTGTGTSMDSAEILRRMAGRQSAFGDLMQKAGMAPATAAMTEDMIRMLRSRDPNKGASNIGKIVGLIAKYY